MKSLSIVLSRRETKRKKDAQEVRRKLTKSRDAARSTAVLTGMVNPALWHGRASQYGQPCIGARLVARLCYWPCVPSSPAARLYRPVHGRASFHPFPLALPGLRLTSILPWISPESYLSHQNPKVLLESTDQPKYKHNWIKEGESIPF